MKTVERITPIVKLNLKLQCDGQVFYYSEVLVGGTITVAEVAAGGGNSCVELVFKNYTPFTNCISKINNTTTDNAKYIDVVMPMYNLIEHSNNYSKISGRLWQYYRDETALTNAGAVDNFPRNSALFKFKQKITGSTGDDATTNVRIMVLLKYLSNSWRTLEMPLANCEINLILTFSANQVTAFAITDTKFYVPVVDLSTDDNAKLL